MANIVLLCEKGEWGSQRGEITTSPQYLGGGDMCGVGQAAVPAQEGLTQT